jgi:hypothetical protein
MDIKFITGICTALKPIEGFLILMGNDGKEISRKRVGKEPEPICKFCGKSWDKH